MSSLVSWQCKPKTPQQEVKQRVWLLECKSPTRKAFVLGLIALGCLLAAHIIALMIGCSFSNTDTYYLNFCYEILTLGGGVCGLDDGGKQDRSNCGSGDTYDGHMDEQRVKIRMWIHKQTFSVFRKQSVFPSCHCLCRFVFSKYRL
uniref:Uncharacterized protein n=1 Tax=Brassica oleracea var. oleracea TaxID=109376 RepID=A0A0D3C7S7_BRAOL